MTRRHTVNAEHGLSWTIIEADAVSHLGRRVFRTSPSSALVDVRDVTLSGETKYATSIDVEHVVHLVELATGVAVDTETLRVVLRGYAKRREHGPLSTETDS